MKDELLIKFLLKETSSEEEAYVKEWIAVDSNNKKKFEAFKLIWDTSEQIALENSIDENVAWQRFKLLRDKETGQAPSPYSEEEPIAKVEKLDPQYIRKPFRWMNIAASIVIGLSLLTGIYLYWIAPSHPYFSSIEFASGEEASNYTLPDGSTITLNKHSKVRYSEPLFAQKRTVKMSGEVFFDVQKDPNKHFEVTANDVTVRVLGTSFNVKSNDKTTEVIVETGLVQLSRNDVLIKLAPDEKAIARVDASGFEQKEQTDKLYDYYRSKVFKLDGTPLWRFVEVLNDVYKAKIVIENSAIASLPLTTTFDNDSLPGILNTLNKTLHLRTERNGNTITIKR
ncbi:FecR family protein [Olivibacter domesticus]|uniref:FecR family protein n=1 Tax=Olivibacter domesticus TaxID=407022 RepID=A0A1H7I0L6_OLID1|nr:FecR domain-containing protein [Olivibacter domesticus]SEK55924.1 FecR family protein [Olivibacter domesticus]